MKTKIELNETHTERESDKFEQTSNTRMPSTHTVCCKTWYKIESQYQNECTMKRVCLFKMSFRNRINKMKDGTNHMKSCDTAIGIIRNVCLVDWIDCDRNRWTWKIIKFIAGFGWSGDTPESPRLITFPIHFLEGCHKNQIFGLNRDQESIGWLTQVRHQFKCFFLPSEELKIRNDKKQLQRVEFTKNAMLILDFIRSFPLLLRCNTELSEFEID